MQHRSPNPHTTVSMDAQGSENFRELLSLLQIMQILNLFKGKTDHVGRTDGRTDE
jgi:hypothetical protein